MVVPVSTAIAAAEVKRGSFILFRLIVKCKDYEIGASLTRQCGIDSGEEKSIFWSSLQSQHNQDQEVWD